MVKRLDEALGRPSDSLRSVKLLGDTVVLYTTDHGNHFKTRNNEYKRSCHESAIRLPTAIQGPGLTAAALEPAHRSCSICRLRCWMPRACRFRQRCKDVRCCPLCAQPVEWPDDVFIQISEAQVGRALRTKRWKYGVDAPDKQGGRTQGPNAI